MKRFAFAILVAAISSAAVAGAQETAPVNLDRIVAVVGETPITYFDVRERILQKQQSGEIQNIPTDSVALLDLERHTLDDMVDEELLLQKAKELKIDVPDADLTNTVDAQIKRIRTQFPSESEYRAELAKAGLGTPEEYRRYLMDQLRRNEMIQRTVRKLREDSKIIPANVTEAEVREAFDKNKAMMPPRPASVTFRQIVINPKPSEAAKATARAKAESLLVELKKGADFASLAKRESMDPGSKEVGGDLGWQRRGYYVPEFDRWLFGPYALSPGTLSPVVETPFGYHIIRVDRATPAEVKARHILIRPTVDSAQVEKAKVEADSVAVLWRSGVPFDTLAKKYHDYANKEETSLLTPIARDSLPATYQQAFAGKGANDIAVFQIPGTAGTPKFVVAELLTSDPGGPQTLDSVKEFVRDRLAQEGGMRRYLDALRKQTYVSIRLGESTPTAGR